MMNVSKIVAAAYDHKASLDIAAAFLRSGLTVDIWNSNAYCASSRAQVSVYNLESFFFTAEDEYASVSKLFGSVPEEVVCFMKSDSSLRGNIGSELRALIDSRNEDRLVFLTAFPNANKFIVDGIQYQSSGEDKNVLANALELIDTFNHTPAYYGEGLSLMGEGIYIPNCSSREAFEQLIEALKDVRVRTLAGTSALAERLVEVYEMPRKAYIDVDGKHGVLSLAALEWEADT